MSPARLRSLDTAAAAHDADPAGRSGAHLAGYSFRFDSAAVQPDEAPVAPVGREWTLGETLAEVARRDATLRLGSGGVRLAHAHRLPDLARAVARHAGPLAVWLRLGLDRDATQRVPLTSSSPVGFGATAWDAVTRLHAAWFVRLFEAPPGRLALRPGVSVTDLAAFRASVAGRLAAGPDAAGADGLRADLGALYERFGAEAERAGVPDVVRARAA
jgi:hypothetical protein